MPPAAEDPLPLRPRLLWALASATTRELIWGRRAVSREIRRWKSAAEHIPDAQIREDALNVIAYKRGNTDGAALFWTLVRGRDFEFLRLLVAHEMIWDFLDNVSERGAGCGARNGLQLHLAVLESLDPDAPMSDYYRYHPWCDDGGYLRSLVETCRAGVRALASYTVVQPIVLREARRAAVQAFNHESDETARERVLQQWAVHEYRSKYDHEASWFELTAAASAPLAIYALLALATNPGVDRRTACDTFDVYFPWVSLAVVMLDSYADKADDAACGAHSYFEHYNNETIALRRLRESIARAAHGVMSLPNGRRHAVLIACMTAMYLSKDSVLLPDLHGVTRQAAEAGGSLTELLLPILRLWRIRYGQQAA